MNYLGIDPGQKGGIALLNSKGLELYLPMPDTIQGIFAQIHRAKVLSDGELTMVAEKAQAMPNQGACSMFNYGKHYGCFEAFAMALGIRFVEVASRTWKSRMSLNSDKLASIKLAEKLFPIIDLLPSARCKNKHDGMAEAVLLAEYGRRNNL